MLQAIHGDPLMRVSAFEGAANNTQWGDRDMPDDIRLLFLQSYFYSLSDSVAYKTENADLQSIFLMDLRQDSQGLVLFDYNKIASPRKIGEYFVIKLTDEPPMSYQEKQN